MDAPETPSVVGEPSRPSPDDVSSMPAPRPRPPHLGALYTSPGAPSVLVYFAEHHNLGMPLMPRWLEDAAEPAPGHIAEVLEPLEFEILYRTDGGKLIQATVRLDPASLPAPPGDWVVRTTGDWILRVSHAG